MEVSIIDSWFKLQNVIARSEIIRRIIERRSNPVTMHDEFNHGIASSPFRSLRSFRLLAMTFFTTSLLSFPLLPPQLPRHTPRYAQFLFRSWVFFDQDAD